MATTSRFADVHRPRFAELVKRRRPFEQQAAKATEELIPPKLLQ